MMILIIGDLNAINIYIYISEMWRLVSKNGIQTDSKSHHLSTKKGSTVSRFHQMYEKPILKPASTNGGRKGFQYCSYMKKRFSTRRNHDGDSIDHKRRSQSKILDGI